jgi:L-fuconolactonase
MTIFRFDSHQHFWRLNRFDYYWMSPDMTQIYRDFMPDDFKLHLENHHVEKTILVQAAAAVAETEFLLGLADEYEWISGVVGWVDIESVDAVKTLERLSAHPKFVGIRPMIHDNPDPDWMLNPLLSAVFDWLADSQLTFDALVRPMHLPNLGKLLARHDKLKTVIDHAGKPDIKAGEFDGWARDMASLANNTRVKCKFSGLLTEAAPGAGYSDLSIYIDHLLKCFEPGRLMWGSDWPVLELASQYDTWVSICNQALSILPASDQRKIWHDTAEAFYCRPYK